MWYADDPVVREEDIDEGIGRFEVATGFVNFLDIPRVCVGGVRVLVKRRGLIRRMECTRSLLKKQMR